MRDTSKIPIASRFPHLHRERGEARRLAGDFHR